MKPAEVIWHWREVHFLMQPLLHLRGQVADDIPIERSSLTDKDVAPLRCQEFPSTNRVHVPNDLTDRILLGGLIYKVVAPRALELEDRDGVTGFIFGAEGDAPVKGNDVWALRGAAVQRKV